MKLWMSAGIGLLGLLAACYTAQGANRYVKAGGPGTNGGGSWAEAYPTLEAALNAPSTGTDDVIHLAQGTYRAGTTAEDAFWITDAGLKIKGGYQGLTGSPGLRDINLYPTILDGSLGGTSKRKHIIRAEYLANHADDHQIIIEGVTIQNAHANGGSGPIDLKGSGASIIESAVAFVRCKFLNLKADWHGGAIHIQDYSATQGGTQGYKARLDVVNCLFEYCEAGRGGAIANAEAEVWLANVIVRHCEAVASGGFNEPIDGGGFINYEPGRPGESVAHIDCCTFHLNAAEGAGASLLTEEGVIHADNSIFWDGSDSVVIGPASDFTNCITGNNITLPPYNQDSTNYNVDPLLSASSIPACNSAAVNSGDASRRPGDRFDLDGDASQWGFLLPLDYADEYRVIGPNIDRGAIELQGECCFGNINGDGVVNVDDLIAVVNAWGNCAAPCPADISNSPCFDGQVGVDELLAVINSWGECPPWCPGEGGIAGGIPQSYTDCANSCAAYSGQAWADCMQACFKILCEQGQTEYCED